MFSNDDALYSLQCFYAAIGTCSAIAHAANGKNGNWCCTGGTISSSLVAWYVRELEDDSRVSRRDIYDVLLISDISVLIIFTTGTDICSAPERYPAMFTVHQRLSPP